MLEEANVEFFRNYFISFGCPLDVSSELFIHLIEHLVVDCLSIVRLRKTQTNNKEVTDCLRPFQSTVHTVNKLHNLKAFKIGEALAAHGCSPAFAPAVGAATVCERQEATAAATAAAALRAGRNAVARTPVPRLQESLY